MDKGVLLVALGNPIIYGGAAFNLALSIKLNDPDCNITVLHDGQALSRLKAWHLQYFDKLIELPKSNYTIDGHTEYQRVKLLIEKYTPYDITIYLDVDVIWNPNRKISWLFGELIDKEFEIITAGYYDIDSKVFNQKRYTLWGDASQMIQYWKLKKGKIYECQSTFVYFKKTEKVKQLFEKALEIYDDPTAPCSRWANGKPDEYCYNVAENLCDLYPTMTGFYPIYIHMLNGMPVKDSMKSKYWGVSTTGSKPHIDIAKYYNELVNYYCEQANIPDRFYHKNKGEYIRERKNG